MFRKNKNKKVDNRIAEIPLDKGLFGKYSFVNRNYQLLKATDEMAKTEKWTTLKLFLKQKLALFGLVVFVSIILLSLILPPFLQDAYHVNPIGKHSSPFTSSHVFGTDYLGRDI